jgi:hypothetical protein
MWLVALLEGKVDIKASLVQLAIGSVVDFFVHVEEQASYLGQTMEGIQIQLMQLISILVFDIHL